MPETGQTEKDIFLRNTMLWGEEATRGLSSRHVAVFGLGGVGAAVAEALARAGVGTLTLVDFDSVGVSNINRQLGALHSTLGQPKAEVMGARVRDINPDIVSDVRVMRYDAETRDELLGDGCDYILDAIDIVTSKLDLIVTALTRGIPILSALGTGNKTDPFSLTITDISDTSVCPLARVMRRELRARGVRHHEVLWSREAPVTPLSLEAPPPGRRSLPSSVPWLPVCAGMMMAGHAVMKMIETSRS